MVLYRYNMCTVLCACASVHTPTLYVHTYNMYMYLSNFLPRTHFSKNRPRPAPASSISRKPLESQDHRTRRVLIQNLFVIQSRQTVYSFTQPTVGAAQMSKQRRKSFHKDSSTGNHYEHDHDTGESRWMKKSEVDDLAPGE